METVTECARNQRLIILTLVNLLVAAILTVNARRSLGRVSNLHKNLDVITMDHVT